MRAGFGLQFLQGACVRGTTNISGICGVALEHGTNPSITQVYAILDEVFLAGEIQETSKQVVLTRLEHLDKLE